MAQESACAKEILTTLMRRAYRRPVESADWEWVQQFYQEGRREGTFRDGIELGLRRILASPPFLVRAEREPANLPAGKPYRITDLELASRLSFLIWSSIPDDELIEVASQNKLHLAPVLEGQVRRMLADPKASALVENFGDQLLYLRNLPATSPDGLYYPDWDDELRKGFRRETELLFQSIIQENRNVVDLLTADYTFLNERLAKHYGIPEHLRLAVPAGDSRTGSRVPPRVARSGQRSLADLGAEFPHFARQARCLGAGEHPGYASARAASERAASRRHEGRQENNDAPRADDSASIDGALRELPQTDGSHWLRTRKFRRRRKVADQTGRGGRSPAGYVRRSVGWHQGQRSNRVAAGSTAIIRRNLSE